MNVAIEIVEQDMREKRTVEVRHVVTESHKRLTATSATKILRREFPDVPRLSALKSIDKKGQFFAMHSVKPTEKCNFHYVWRHYYLTEE